MAEARALLWVDLETTGTDEHKDSIIEIGLAITNLELVVRAEASILVAPRHEQSDPETWSDFVSAMHTGNGLIDALNEAASDDSLGRLSDANTMIEEWMEYDHDETGLRPHHYLCSGSGVSHFDRRWIKAHLPALEKWLQYPNLDVGVVRREMDVLGFGDLIPPFNESKAHRALDDVRTHIEELRARREMWSLLRRASAAQTVNVLFDGPPGAVPGRFVEVERLDGSSVNVGTWVHQGRSPDRPESADYWALRLDVIPASAGEQAPAPLLGTIAPSGLAEIVGSEAVETTLAAVPRSNYPDTMAAMLPGGIHYRIDPDLIWKAREIGEFQAERLIEAGYVLQYDTLHDAPHETNVEPDDGG